MREEAEKLRHRVDWGTERIDSLPDGQERDAALYEHEEDLQEWEMLKEEAHALYVDFVEVSRDLKKAELTIP